MLHYDHQNYSLFLTNIVEIAAQLRVNCMSAASFVDADVDLIKSNNGSGMRSYITWSKPYDMSWMIPCEDC